MSAYASGGQRPLFNSPENIQTNAANQPAREPINGPLSGPISGMEELGRNSHLIDKLEGFVSATRQIEAALQQERMRSRRFQEELKGAHEHFERLLTERDFKCRELALQEGKIRSVLGQERERGNKLEKQASTLKTEVDRLRAELKQYQGQWSVILQREREAKNVIEECNQQRRQIEDLESSLKKTRNDAEEYRVKNEQAERHTKTYQTELQSVLVRLHSAESKFSSVQKEFQVLHQSRKNVEEEIARTEKTAKERSAWELQKELEKNTALVRDETAKRIREEYEHKLISEKLAQSKQLQGAEKEIMRLRSELSKVEKDRQVMNARSEDMKTALSAERNRALSLESAVQELVEKSVISAREALNEAAQNLQDSQSSRDSQNSNDDQTEFENHLKNQIHLNHQSIEIPGEILGENTGDVVGLSVRTPPPFRVKKR